MSKKNILLTLSGILCMLSALFISCDNLDTQEEWGESHSSGVVHFYISEYEENEIYTSRTVLPTSVDKDNLYFTLAGALKGETKTIIENTDGDKVENMSYDNLTSSAFRLEAGEWEFTMQGKRKNLEESSQKISYTTLITGDAEATIKSGDQNSIIFSMKAEKDGLGSIRMEINCAFGADSESSLSSLNAKLYIISDETGDVAEDATYEDSWSTSEENPVFTITTDTDTKKTSVVYKKDNIPSKTYLFSITLKTTCNNLEEEELATFHSDVVRVSPGCESYGSVEITPRQVYPIEYVLKTPGGENADWKSGVSYPKYYSPYERTDLPNSTCLVNTTAAFVSWCADSEDGATSTDIAKGSTGVKTFYAKWRTGGIYVDTLEGDDSNDGTTTATAFKTLARALEVPSSPDVEYKINISGTVEVEDGAAAKEIGIVAINSAKAKSITLIGYNNNHTDKIVQKTGVTGKSTLKIFSDPPIPVYIENLIIEGGDGDSGTKSGGAIYVSSAGTTVTLGQYVKVTGGTADYGGGLCVDKSGCEIIIDGATIENCGISGSLKGGGIYIASGSDLEFKSGEIKNNGNSGVLGGGIYCEGTISIPDNSTGTVTGNTALKGGGIYYAGSNSEINGLIVGGDDSTDGNTAKEGGALYNAGTLTVSGSATKESRIAYNVADSETDAAGAGIFNDSGATLTLKGKVIIDSNECKHNDSLNGNGGGVYNAGTLTMVADGTDVPAISSNNAVSGGGVYNVESTAIFTMSAGSIASNTATDGGGVYSATSAVFTMSGGTIGSNTASTSGGGVYNAGSMFMYGTAVVGDASATSVASKSAGIVAASNKATGNGGGIYSTGTLYIGYKDSNKTVDDEFTGGIFYNYASNGGGIYSYGGSMYISLGTVAYNAVSSSGGGLFTNGTSEFVGGNILKNEADSGGGIYNYGGKLTLSGSITVGDSSAISSATEDNCSNYATLGGGVYNNDSAVLEFGYDNNSSGGIYYNYAPTGGGVYNANPNNIVSQAEYIANNGASSRQAETANIKNP